MCEIIHTHIHIYSTVHTHTHIHSLPPSPPTHTHAPFMHRGAACAAICIAVIRKVGTNCKVIKWSIAIYVCIYVYVVYVYVCVCMCVCTTCDTAQLSDCWAAVNAVNELQVGHTSNANQCAQVNKERARCCLSLPLHLPLVTALPYPASALPHSLLRPQAQRTLNIAIFTATSAHLTLPLAALPSPSLSPSLRLSLSLIDSTCRTKPQCCACVCMCVCSCTQIHWHFIAFYLPQLTFCSENTRHVAGKLSTWNDMPIKLMHLLPDMSQAPPSIPLSHSTPRPFYYR